MLFFVMYVADTFSVCYCALFHLLIYLFLLHRGLNFDVVIYVRVFLCISGFYIMLKKSSLWASLVAQWLRIRLPMQGTRVRALVWEDPTCRGATGPVSHNY